MFVPQTIYNFHTTYVWDFGIEAAVPAAPPGTALEPIAVAAPCCYKTVTWLAQADESMNPQPPDWNTGTPNEVLVQKAISSTFLTGRSDGTTVQTIAGVYRYLLLVAPTDVDPLSFGGPPWDATLANLVDPTLFMKLLTLPQPTSPNPAGGSYGGRQGQAGLGGQLQGGVALAPGGTTVFPSTGWTGSIGGVIEVP